MSGRSAYVRKKITETKTNDKSGGAVFRGRARSNASSDNATISEYPVEPMPPIRPGHFDRDRDVTGVGTTNARLLKFTEPARENEALAFQNEINIYGDQSNGSQSGSSVDGRRESAGGGPPHNTGPLPDFAYARARRPVIKTEDVSGIEKSGLRNKMDKKSEEVRKGLMRTFGFGKKNKKSAQEDKGIDFRPQSSATVRPSPAQGGYSADGYEADVSPVQFPGPSHPWEEPGSGMMSPPTSARFQPQTTSAPPIKRWIGAGRPVQRWNKLRKDPELWDPNGDVLVFFGHKGQSPRPNPSFRLSSHIIEATESRFLITLLREGSTEEDIHMPPSPIGAPPMLQRHGGQYSPNHLSPLGGGAGGYGRGGQPTPPISEDASLGETDGQISYEMYFSPPPNASTNAEQLRHHITTRNVFALLYHASLVGLSLYQALSDLHTRLESYMPPETDNVGTILNYLSARGIDDVRGDPEAAVSLLAWSEGSEVRWEEGWRESFLHCAGMYAQLEGCADFRHLTPITRALLERACLETQLRVQAAEERLAGFQYGDLWPPSFASIASGSGPVSTAPAKAAADRLQRFLLQHYTKRHGRWPPLPPSQAFLLEGGNSGGGGGSASRPPAIGTGLGADGADEEMWLTRTVAQALQKDFGALYDYLVNRDIVWDESEARSSRKWMMVSESRGNRGFEADTPDLPLTDMLIEFDNKHRFPHIPHPYPLVPESIPPPSIDGNGNGTPPVSGGGLFGGKSSSAKRNASGQDNANAGGGGAARSGATERRIQLAYTEATNICILGSEFTHSDLIDAFGKFEKMDRISEVDPATARRGRWVLIYGILQTLASVSVDAPNVRYHEDVPYHLSPRLKGAKIPPWKTGKHGGHYGSNSQPEEASHELSHCWIVPKTWNAGYSSQGESAAASGAESAEDMDPGEYSPGNRSYNFPRFPRPPPPPSTAGRSSVTGYTSHAGYHTPAGTRSVRSASSRAPSTVGGPAGYPSFSSAGSVLSYSESEAGSVSVRSPSSATTLGSGARKSGRSDTVGSSRGHRHLGQFERVAEHQRQEQQEQMMMEWAAPNGQMYAYANTTTGSSSSGGNDGRSQYQPAPLRPSRAGHGGEGRRGGAGGERGGGAGFLVLDEMMDDQRSFTTARSGSGRDRAALSAVRGGTGRSGGGGGNGHGQPRLGGRGAGTGSETDSVGPVIRDFDELDVIDDHAP